MPFEEAGDFFPHPFVQQFKKPHYGCFQPPLVVHSSIIVVESMDLMSYSVRYNIDVRNSYIAALQLEVILNFICAVIIRHLPFLSVCRQIRRQTLPLQGNKGKRRR